jgi:hypothetical protein
VLKVWPDCVSAVEIAWRINDAFVGVLAPDGTLLG